MVDDELLTIEQLAARSGMTVRNIRAHGARGLLPPPQLRGRTGYYGPEHLARLQLISALQQQRFNLAAIKSLLESPSAPSADEVVAFSREAIGAWLTEPPEVLEEAALPARFGVEIDTETLARLHKLGVVERLGDRRIRIVNPVVLRIGARLAADGYDAQHLVDVLALLLKHINVVAEAFVHMFLDVKWRAHVDAGMPVDALPELSAHIEQLRPLATQAVVAAFQQAMAGASHRALMRLAEEVDNRPRARGIRATG